MILKKNTDKKYKHKNKLIKTKKIQLQARLQ